MYLFRRACLASTLIVALASAGSVLAETSYEGMSGAASGSVRPTALSSADRLSYTTAFDALSEIQKGDLIFIPVSDEKIDLSTLSIVSASGRNLSVPASLLIQHLAQMMEKEGVPTI